MKSTQTILIVLLTFAIFTPAMTQSAWGAGKYGDAIVENGTLILLRNGERLSYKANSDAVQVNELDVVRVGAQSKVILKTIENSTLTLGSNAILHIKPWERKKKKGFMSMLFGRFRAAVDTLSGGKSFKVRTAQATIGVKGTEYTLAASVNGNAWVKGHEGVTGLAGRVGADADVTKDLISVVVGNRAASSPVPVPQAIQEMGLDSPPANSNEALTLPGRGDLDDAGAIPGRGDGNSSGDDDEGDSEDSTGDDMQEILDDLTSGALEQSFSSFIVVGFEDQPK